MIDLSDYPRLDMSDLDEREESQCGDFDYGMAAEIMASWRDVERLRLALEAARLPPACDLCGGSGTHEVNEGDGYMCSISCPRCSGLDRDEHNAAIDAALRG